MLNRLLPRALGDRLLGPFAVQPNNSTRTYEYPWAFYATPLAPGMKVLEIGGGLSGFQFVLSQYGCHVVNVDPGMEAKGVGWPCDPQSMATLNRRFGANVDLRNTVVTEAGLESGSYDRAFSISVLEHLPPNELTEAMRAAFDCLKPGGCFVITVDLFLDLKPFTTKQENAYGRNVDVRRLIETAPFEILHGERSELYGFPQFDHNAVQSELSSYLLGDYPALTQCVVLKKPSAKRGEKGENP